ncbi:glycoside hydrolase family 13 protein [Winogradskya consettensis]|uniref:Alpha-glucosidase n=1 Tax=Winogradskya consettensis TaxID=113560 RepID=A0A919SUP7_9ACTN|nr:alpha-amylase family glycosyl hydrolase [Actinoplanes consettensis]GIM77393.1 alpha-glucosidase [Actinoplanes consettensis]
MPDMWWRDAVVYQIYPRSFADNNGDGVGDLDGITARLGYVAGLGVGAIWLTPFQRSPQADHGYDVSDYTDVDPLFGDLAAFDALVARAHELGLRVIVDVVPNHCSNEHPLFKDALAAGPGSAARDRFHFADGRGDEPPNNWPSVFGGPAWTRVTEGDGRPGQWFLHLYAPEQPDWNWRNPLTADFFAGVLRFWFDRGVDGLRIDVAHGLYKAAGLPDLDDPGAVPPMRLRGNPLASDQEEVHDVYRQWRHIADSYDPPRALIGEVNLDPERAARYVRPDELHQAFAFALVAAPWDATAWADVGTRLMNGGTPVTWVVENHDVVRTPTRYGNPARAKAALLAILFLPGAAYVYQGQERGLPEVDVSPSDRQDPAWTRSGISRDGCRVPLPWQSDPADTYGFSPPGSAPPWLPVPPDWGTYATDPAFLRHALALRRRLLHGDPVTATRPSADVTGALHADITVARHEYDGTLTDGSAGARHEYDGTLTADDAVVWRVHDNGLLTAVREDAFVLAIAMGDRAAELPPGEVLLTSGPLTADGLLPPDTAAWLSVGE